MKTTVLFAALLLSSVIGYSQEVKSSTDQRTKSNTQLKAADQKKEITSVSSAEAEARLKTGIAEETARQGQKKGKEVRNEVSETKKTVLEKSTKTVEDAKSEIKQTNAVSSENSSRVKVDADNRNNLHADASLQSNSSVTAGKDQSSVKLNSKGSVKGEAGSGEVISETAAISPETRKVVNTTKTEVNTKASATKKAVANKSDVVVKTTAETKTGIRKNLHSGRAKKAQAGVKVNAGMKTTSGLKLK